MRLVVDLSNNNGSVDFARLAKVPGLEGVYLKATEGRTFHDPYFLGWRREARRHGLRVGAYHFARRGDVGEEAASFVRAVGTIERRDLRPALDAEVEPGPAWVAWARTWNAIVTRELGVGPLFYSYPAWLDALHADRPIGYGLWLASFGRNDGSEHPYSVPAPWRRAVMHQFSSNARVAGVAGPCDLSSAPSLRAILAHPFRGLL